MVFNDQIGGVASDDIITIYDGNGFPLEGKQTGLTQINGQRDFINLLKKPNPQPIRDRKRTVNHTLRESLRPRRVPFITLHPIHPLAKKTPDPNAGGALRPRFSEIPNLHQRFLKNTPAIAPNLRRLPADVSRKFWAIIRSGR